MCFLCTGWCVKYATTFRKFMESDLETLDRYRELDSHQNLKDCCLINCPHLCKISSTSVHSLLWYAAKCQLTNYSNAALARRTAQSYTKRTHSTVQLFLTDPIGYNVTVFRKNVAIFIFVTFLSGVSWLFDAVLYAVKISARFYTTQHVNIKRGVVQRLFRISRGTFLAKTSKIGWHLT